MTRKTTSTRFCKIKQFFPYFLAGLAILALVFVGSLDKKNASASLSLSNFADEDYANVSIDQLSELYVVASLSDAIELTSANTVASNYIVAVAMRNSGQASTAKLEKPSIIFTSSRGVITHTVTEGESMDSIAAKYHLSTDQIRWSNGLKTTYVSAGDTLYLPSKSGIVYTVKKDDTVESIAKKYGSNATEIIALNDLETSGIAEGMRIILHNGKLPEKERPEYVPPAPRRVYTYSFLGNTSQRRNIRVIGYNYHGGGQCVGYAVWWRNLSGLSTLAPVNPNWGNANVWAIKAANAGFRVDSTPEVGAVFQTSSGYFGHVGIVVGLNGDGSIVVQETNYGYQVGRVTEATIPASAVGNFRYIH